MEISETFGKIEGRISLQGGMIISEIARSLSLSTHLMWLVRFGSFRHWQEDWQIGLITEKNPCKRNSYSEV